MKTREKDLVIACGLAVIRRGREFLISQRNADDTFGSFWEFPGGKKKHGETFEECVVREAEEELGVKIAVQKKFMEFRKKHQNRILWLNFFLCDYLSGIPKPLECQKVKWVDVEELKSYQFPPANEKVIEHLIRQFA